MSYKRIFALSTQGFWKSNFEALFVGTLCIFRGTVGYSTGPKVPKIFQMTFNKYFDEKIITIRCVVLEISYFEKSLEMEVITPFTAIGRNMTILDSEFTIFDIA